MKRNYKESSKEKNILANEIVEVKGQLEASAELNLKLLKQKNRLQNKNNELSEEKKKNLS